MAFDLTQYIKSGFNTSSIENTTQGIQEAANAIIQNKDTIVGAFGSEAPINWAKQALSIANEAIKNGTDISKETYAGYGALDWLSGSPQSHIRGNIVGRVGQNISEAQANADRLSSNIANRVDFSALTAERVAKEYPNGLASNDALSSDLTKLQGSVDFLKSLGVDTSGYESTIGNVKNLFSKQTTDLAGSQVTPEGTTRTASGFQPTSEVTPPSSANTTTPQATPATFNIAGTSGSEAFTPTDYSTRNNLADLQIKVMNTDPALSANKDFVNAVFKAFHNRDATAAELAMYTGKTVADVRSQIVAGAQKAGLPTVSTSTTSAKTGLMTPDQAKSQGLQKVLREDQLGAFTEGQIIRDNAGGIYLNPATVTSDQIAAVAAGKTAAEVAGTKPTPPSSNADAQTIDQTINSPDANTILNPSTPGYDPVQAIDAISSAAIGSTQKLIDQLTAQIDNIQKQKTAAEATQAQIGEQVTNLTFGSTTESKLAQVMDEQKITEKRDKLTEVLNEIATEKAKLNLGLTQEGNKLAPLSIIGRRQQALTDQANGTIGALAAVASVYQDDLNFAQQIVSMTMDAVNNDRSNQLSALEFLSGLQKDKIVELSSEEQAAVTARIDTLRQSIADAKDNADSIMKLIAQYPDAAVKAKISLTDSPALAASKMAPYIAEQQKADQTAARTTVVDLGGKKVLIDMATGKEIESYANTLGPGETATLSPDDQKRADFAKDVKAAIDDIDQRNLTWGAAWDGLHAMYPDVPNEILDGILGGGQRPDGSWWGRAGDGNPFSTVGTDTNTGTVDTTKQTSLMSKIVSTFAIGALGGQCGHFVNQLTGLRMGDSYASKAAYIDKSIKVPKIGDVFVMALKGTKYANTGHTGFVKSVGPIKADGTFDIVAYDSNWNSVSAPETVQQHVINSSQISGFVRPGIILA